MATSRTFSAMLNEYLTVPLMRNEYEKRMYLFQTIDKDNGWKGGTLPVPFEGNHASSVEFGQFTSDTDVSEYAYVRGQITSYKEVTGTLKFNYTDLKQHDGKIPETTFLRMLPNQVEQFANWLKVVTSIVMLNGPKLATVKVSGTALGIVGVDRIDRFTLSQKILLKGDTQAAAAYYITAINVNYKQLTVSSTRGGGAADVSAYTVGDNARILIPSVNTGADADYFTSLRSSLLPTAYGGASTLYGQTKTAYPYLQAWHRHGGSIADDTFGRVGLEINATNILDKIFDVYVEMRQFTVGNPKEVWLSYKHWGSIMKILESQKGAFRMADSVKASEYGWDEVVIGGIKGQMKIVAIQEMDDDVIFLVDPKAMTFFSNGLINQVETPDGLKFYTARATTGYTFFSDWIMYGEFVLKAPQKCGVIHSINY